MIARTIAAPIVVDLCKNETGAVTRPHRNSDPDFGDSLDILAGRKITNSKLEPLRSVIIGKRGQKLAVRADLPCSKPEIFSALSLDRFVKQHLLLAVVHGLSIPGPVLRAGVERPPILKFAVADRDRA